MSKGYITRNLPSLTFIEQNDESEKFNTMITSQGIPSSSGNTSGNQTKDESATNNQDNPNTNVANTNCTLDTEENSQYSLSNFC